MDELEKLNHQVRVIEKVNFTRKSMKKLDHLVSKIDLLTWY